MTTKSNGGRQATELEETDGSTNGSTAPSTSTPSGRRHPAAARAGDDAAAGRVRRPIGAGLGDRQPLPRLGLLRPRLRGRRARQLPDARDRAEQRLRLARRGRAARAPSSTPAVTAAPASSRSRRAASAGASAARTTRGPTTSTARSSPRRTWTRSRTSTGPASGCSRSAAPSSAGSLLVDLSGEAPDPVEHVGDLAAMLDRYRLGDLRARRAASSTRSRRTGRAIAENYNECLHCPGRPPGAERAQRLPQRRVDGGTGRLVRGLDDAERGGRDDGRGDGHARRRPPIAGLPETEHRRRLLLRALPQRADLAPPRLRDAPHPLAAGGRPDRGHLRVVLRAGDDGADRTSTRATRSTSGTRSTARTGASASWPRRGCGPAATSPGRYSGDEGDVHAFDKMVARRYMEALRPAGLPG